MRGSWVEHGCCSASRSAHGKRKGSGAVPSISNCLRRKRPRFRGFLRVLCGFLCGICDYELSIERSLAAKFAKSRKDRKEKQTPDLWHFFECVAAQNSYPQLGALAQSFSISQEKHRYALSSLPSAYLRSCVLDRVCHFHRLIASGLTGCP